MGVGVLGGGGYNYCVKMSGEMLFHYLCIVAYVCVRVCVHVFEKILCHICHLSFYSYGHVHKSERSAASL